MAARIPYGVYDIEALAEAHPSVIIKAVDHPALYKKVKAAHELGLPIPGVTIGKAFEEAAPLAPPADDLRDVPAAMRGEKLQPRDPRYLSV